MGVRKYYETSTGCIINLYKIIVIHTVPEGQDCFRVKLEGVSGNLLLLEREREGLVKAYKDLRKC